LQEKWQKKSIVLLKNEQNLLPLSKNIGTIAVIGPVANNRRELIGSWSAAGDWTKAITLLEGIRQSISPETKILYAKGCSITDDSTQYIQEAINLAKKAEVVILAVGEAAWMTGEAASRSDLGLPGIQQKLAEAIIATGKPVVTVLMNGRPLTISWLTEHTTAMLETWFGGTMAGPAIADVIFGDYNPSGKLPVTFPRSTGQIPIFYNCKNTGRPFDASNKYTSKYLDIDNSPLFPFGYGLSYTTFEYSNLRLNKNSLNMNDTLVITVSLKNTGKYGGTEIAQLYIHDKVGSVTRPVKELKGFYKVDLSPGEITEVRFKITKNDLAFCDINMNFTAEPGEFEVFVGSNSVDCLKTNFWLQCN